MNDLPPDGRPGPAGPGGTARSPRSKTAIIVAIVAFVALMVAVSVFSKPQSTATAVPYSTFLSKVAASDVKSIEINQGSGRITGVYTDNSAFTTQGPTGTLPAADVDLLNAHKVQRTYVSTSKSVWPTLLGWGVMIALVAGVMIWFSRRTQGQMAGLSGWSRSKAKVHITEKPTTTFKDVAGYDSVKLEIRELVDFLKNPTRFRSIGARTPKGVLLVGPPGTGKTLVARAVAGEAGVPFITITGSEFMEMFVGIGAARVRDLFDTARQNKPAIVFVDEIDAIGRKRGAGLGGGHDEREQTLNQLLSEMDGFEASEGIVVLAATNRPDILDPALLRAGRFDRQVIIPLPTLEERQAILRVHARDKRMTPGTHLETLARGTPGMSGADLENLMNEAALIAVRRGSTEISEADLENARDRVLLGLRRTSLALSPEEKRIVACHEAGHAVLAALLPNADPLHKVSILPTGMALGVTQQLPTEERQLQQRPFLDDALAVRLGGRAAEELVFGMPSTGAQDDLTGATELAIRMVREWGMSEAIGQMAWGPRGPVFLGEELIHSRDYSDRTARVIDEEVARILSEQAARARQVLSEHRAALDAVGAALAANETLEGAEVMAIIEAADRDGQVRVAAPAAVAAGQRT
ncbi:MAG TPA: ATP-dependent zinc metalloprotease FtsH [Acidimicrobiales bacterium]|nr:ATP-dependent zinc metalloprotease FtsH [Acidimicrobiales bacterium]